MHRANSTGSMAEYDKNTDSYVNWSQGESDYWVIEQTRYFQVLGSVQGLDVLELACGEGRISRLIAGRGAGSVLATDISAEMIARAQAANRTKAGAPVHSNLTFLTLDAADDTFTLERPVDLVTAMYLFHYAPSESAVAAMCRLAGRNLKPGGRFVAYTINPDYDFSRQDPQMAERFGFRYREISPPHYELVIGELAVNMWHWSRPVHERALKEAGLADVRWHPVCVPEGARELAASLAWYLENPSCIVVSATKVT